MNINEKKTTPQNGFAADPFTAFDNTNIAAKQDPFDPFGNGKRAENKAPATTSVCKILLDCEWLVKIFISSALFESDNFIFNIFLNSHFYLDGMIKSENSAGEGIKNREIISIKTMDICSIYFIEIKYL